MQEDVFSFLNVGKEGWASFKQNHLGALESSAKNTGATLFSSYSRTLVQPIKPHKHECSFVGTKLLTPPLGVRNPLCQTGGAGQVRPALVFETQGFNRHNVEVEKELIKTYLAYGNGDAYSRRLETVVSELEKPCGG